jgi:hypothetical protein
MDEPACEQPQAILKDSVGVPFTSYLSRRPSKWTHHSQNCVQGALALVHVEDGGVCRCPLWWQAHMLLNSVVRQVAGNWCIWTCMTWKCYNWWRLRHQFSTGLLTLGTSHDQLAVLLVGSYNKKLPSHSLFLDNSRPTLIFDIPKVCNILRFWYMEPVWGSLFTCTLVKACLRRHCGHIPITFYQDQTFLSWHVLVSQQWSWLK